MSNEHRIEQLLVGFFVAMMLFMIWADSLLAKLLLLAVSALCCVSLFWLRRYLSKNGLIVLIITLLIAIASVLINLFFLS